MRKLLLVGALLAVASAPARDARTTTFRVGALVIESCDVGAALSRDQARCAAGVPREVRAAPMPAVHTTKATSAQLHGTSGAARDSTAPLPRILLIRF